jgi:CD63 antigen
LDDHFFSVPKFLIVIGSFIFIIAFFGCCGAYKENYCMVLTFSVLLGLIFVLELAAGISGYVLRNDTKQILTDSLNKTMPDYTNMTLHRDTVIMWDEIQQRVSLEVVFFPQFRSIRSSLPVRMLRPEQRPRLD